MGLFSSKKKELLTQEETEWLSLVLFRTGFSEDQDDALLELDTFIPQFITDKKKWKMLNNIKQKVENLSEEEFTALSKDILAKINNHEIKVPSL